MTSRTYTPRVYRDITIDRAFPSGMYCALVPGYGFIRAETLVDVRAMIRDAMAGVL